MKKIEVGGYILAGAVALLGAASFKSAEAFHAEYRNCDRTFVGVSPSGKPITQCTDYDNYVLEDKVPVAIGAGVLMEAGDVVLLAGLAIGDTRRRRLCSIITSRISPETDSPAPDAEQRL